MRAAIAGHEPEPCPEHAPGALERQTEEARRDLYAAAAEQIRAETAALGDDEPTYGRQSLVASVHEALHSPPTQPDAGNALPLNGDALTNAAVQRLGIPGVNVVSPFDDDRPAAA